MLEVVGLLNGSVKNSGGAIVSGVDGGQSQNGPLFELMHLAAAGNTVVKDRYGLLFKAFSSFFFFVFVFLLE